MPIVSSVLSLTTARQGTDSKMARVHRRIVPFVAAQIGRASRPYDAYLGVLPSWIWTPPVSGSPSDCWSNKRAGEMPRGPFKKYTRSSSARLRNARGIHAYEKVVRCLELWNFYRCEGNFVCSCVAFATILYLDFKWSMFCRIVFGEILEISSCVLWILTVGETFMAALPSKRSVINVYDISWL